jgi:hypothetical protein
VLVAKVKGTDCTPTWARHVGCAGADDVSAIAIDGSAVRVVGTFADSIDLGDGPQKAQGSGDAFLLTLKP